MKVEAKIEVYPEYEFLFTSKCKNLVVAGARGTGKTVAAIHSTTKMLLEGPQNATSLFISSTLSQAADTVEAPMRQIEYQYPPGFCRYNASKHHYKFFLSPTDIRTLSVLSYENSLRSRHPYIIVLDECASMPANIFDYEISPMLREEYGRLLCIGTVEGKNKFYDLWSRGKDPYFPDWECYMIKAEDSHVFSKEFLERRRREISSSAYAQEYECDFDANVLYGSVYGEFMDRYTIHNTDDSYDYDPSLPVWTSWDLGFTDYTAIWFFQVKNNRLTFIDYFEDNGHETQYYAEVLFKKPYRYTYCLLPFDGFSRNMRGKPISQQLEGYGFKTHEVKAGNELLGIDKGRDLLKIARFNKRNCSIGWDHLKRFKFKIDSRSGEKLGVTQHDIHSHAADAFRYCAVSDQIYSSSQEQPHLIDNWRGKMNPRIENGDYNVFG